MIEYANQAQVFDGMRLTLPNRCSYEGCGTPLQLVLEHCSTCLRLVHLLCQVCFKEGEEITTTCLDLLAAAHPSTARTMQETIEDFKVAYSRLQTAQITLISEDGEEVEEKEKEGEDEDDLSIPENALTKTR